MDMTQWANSYFQSAMQLKERIAQLRQLQQHSPGCDYQERITLLYTEYRHLMEVYSYLSNYYKTQKGGAFFE